MSTHPSRIQKCFQQLLVRLQDRYAYHFRSELSNDSTQLSQVCRSKVAEGFPVSLWKVMNGMIISVWLGMARYALCIELPAFQSIVNWIALLKQKCEYLNMKLRGCYHRTEELKRKSEEREASLAIKQGHMNDWRKKNVSRVSSPGETSGSNHLRSILTLAFYIPTQDVIVWPRIKWRSLILKFNPGSGLGVKKPTHCCNEFMKEDLRTLTKTLALGIPLWNRIMMEIILLHTEKSADLWTEWISLREIAFNLQRKRTVKS